MKPQRLTEPKILITSADWKAAEEYQPNCGPTALAGITGIKILEACQVIPNFKERGYTSPKMMKEALSDLGIKWTERFNRTDGKLDEHKHTLTKYGLVRIQLDGPWYGRFAYHHTHWAAAAEFEFGGPRQIWVCDVNNSHLWATQLDWEGITMPTLLPKRGNGKWFVTHRWEFE